MRIKKTMYCIFANRKIVWFACQIRTDFLKWIVELVLTYSRKRKLTMSLNEIQIGQEATVRKINATEQLMHRLRALGMLEGTRVKVVQRKHNGTLVINLRGTRFALGKELTREIEVAV